jgi:hypothetical protein
MKPAAREKNNYITSQTCQSSKSINRFSADLSEIKKLTNSIKNVFDWGKKRRLRERQSRCIKLQLPYCV